MALVDLLKEAGRQLTICNACRYCEGYCAVFPALEMRRTFEKSDVVHLANLCHDCRGCYYACMYAPPHEFAVNLPEVLSAVRVETYREFGWPRVMSKLLGLGVTSTVVASVLGTLAVIGLVFAFGTPRQLLETTTGPGSFYRVLPYLAMSLPFLALGGYVLAVMVGSGVAFWRGTGGRLGELVDRRAFVEAAGDALGLEYLKGGGDGCFYPLDTASHARRRWHGVVFWGFLAAFAATTIAAIMHNLLHITPPYPLWSPPVVLGTGGGLAMILGTTALIRLKWRSDERPAEARMISKDYGFLCSLLLVNVTGMLTLALRESTLLGAILAVHLGTLVAFFLTMPYGKFVHFVYRYGALVRHRIESRAEVAPVGH